MIKMKCFKKLLFIFFSTSCFLFACNAPHKNPFDPNNPDSPYANLTGTIQTLHLPRTGLDKVNVIWENNNETVESDQQGNFHFQNLLREDGWIFFERTGYKRDSLRVNWQTSKEVSVNVILNAFPQLSEFNLYTVILHKFRSNQESQLVINAKITDRDNDIDSVFVVNQEISLRKFLDFDPNKKNYTKILKLFDLQVDNLEKIIGHNFMIHVKDSQGDEVVIGQNNVKRIIHDEILFESPANGQLVPEMPVLQWRPFRPGFAFSFAIEVFTIEETIFSKENISSDALSYTLEMTLPAGDYFWVIWGIDAFQNRSRSKPASFSVN